MQPTLRPLVLGCDQSVSLSVVRTIYEQLAGPVDVLHFGAHLDHENPLVQSKEKGYVNRLVQALFNSILFFCGYKYFYFIFSCL